MKVEVEYQVEILVVVMMMYYEEKEGKFTVRP